MDQMEQATPTAFSASERTAGRRAGLAAAGGVLGALAAMSCCILPLALFALGIGGAWIGNLTALTPYQPIFIGVALAFLAAGYYLVYRPPRAACADGEACARPLPRRGVKLALWIATALVAAALAFPYVARPLLGT
jgi:mercuric ion transport protein